MSASRTIIADREDRLDNVHPGEILREDFLVGSAVPLDDVAAGTGIAIERLNAIITGDEPIDAEVDLRLAGYFGMSDGFFLGLQHDFDLDEARDRHHDDLSRIVRRAA